jgi:hypothetical protein
MIMYNVCLILSLFIIFAWALPPNDALDLALYKSQYISVYVGNQGKEALLRLRFDTHEIVLYSPLSPGHSYDPLDSSEVFSLGAGRGFRWPVKYSYQGDPSVSDPTDTDDKITHHGLLGLGKFSPIWRHFDSWTLSPTRFVLGWQAPNALNLSTSIISVNASNDYTFSTWHLLAQWINQSSQDKDYIPLVALPNGELIRIPLNNTASLPVVKLWDNEEEDQSAQVQLGFSHLKNLIVSYSVSTGDYSLAIHRATIVPLSLGEYVWLFVSIFLVSWTWFPSLAELIQKSYWAFPVALNPSSGTSLRDSNWTFVSNCTLWIGLLALLTVHCCLGSYNFMKSMQEP